MYSTIANELKYMCKILNDRLEGAGVSEKDRKRGESKTFEQSNKKKYSKNYT